MAITRTVELESGHDISVTLFRAGSLWQIEEIDLETSPHRTIEGPIGDMYRTEAEALAAARRIAQKAMG